MDKKVLQHYLKIIYSVLFFCLFGINNTKAQVFIPASFPAGQDSLFNFLQPKWKAILENEDPKILKDLYVTFVIDTSGKVKVKEIGRKNMLSTEINEKIIQVMEELPDWEPATRAGKPEKCLLRLPIRIEW